MLRPGRSGYLRKDSLWKSPPPPRPQPIRLPSTALIDARIRRQTKKRNLWREQYLRLREDGGRWWSGGRPKKPPGPVVLFTYPDDLTLVFHREPERRHPEGTDWVVPCVGVHPKHGPCYHLDSVMVMQQQLLRTVPSKRLLVVRGATADQRPVFRALSQEWVRVPSDRGSNFARYGYHRWLCCIVGASPGGLRED
jgi:hypothetical protein